MHKKAKRKAGRKTEANQNQSEPNRTEARPQMGMEMLNVNAAYGKTGNDLALCLGLNTRSGWGWAENGGKIRGVGEQIGRLSQANRRDNMKINQANANTHATPERSCHALEKKIFFLNLKKT